MLDSVRDYGAIFPRVIIGTFLMWGTWDNVVSAERMADFAGFLAANGAINPMLCAYLSAYAQFICGTLILLGLLTRLAAIVMIINFIVAVVLVHWGQDFRAMFPALVILFVCCFFVLYGAGRLSLDNWLAARTKP